MASQSRILIILAILVFCTSLSTNTASSTPFVVARVSAVDYPEEVATGRAFTIRVTCEYANEVFADIAILERDNSRVIQAITMITQSVGPGAVAFTFNLTAPTSEGIWSLTANTRAWWADSWFADPTQGEKIFDIRIVSQHHLTVRIQSEVGFELDGVRFNNTKTVNLKLTPGFHSLRVEPIVETGQGVRLVFDGWDDNVRSSSRKIMIGTELSLTAKYRKEYRLTIESEFDGVGGDGWYEAGNKAWIGTPPSIPIKGILGWLGFRAVLQRWQGGLNSSSLTGFLDMDRPTVIRAIWNIVWNPNMPVLAVHIATIGFVFASLIMLIKTRKGRRNDRPAKKRLRKEGKVAVLVLLAALSSTVAATQVQATRPDLVETEPGLWRHWGNTYSDTCLIWVGGGLLGQGIRINPYWLESYNTMRFVQDLGQYYGVLTLDRGSEAVAQPELKRTILTIPYPSQSIQKLRKWAHSAGYQHVFLVGYSVGGMAALEEIADADPFGWSTPDGAILITVPIGQSEMKASRLRSNLLLLYGEKMTDVYIQSGKQFYTQIPSEGALEDAWFHKEMHVLKDVSHEAWTIADTGEYTPFAAFLTISFVQRSKALQRSHEVDLMEKALLAGKHTTKLEITAPKQVRTNSLFRIGVKINNLTIDNKMYVLAYDTDNRKLVSLETVATNPSASNLHSSTSFTAYSNADQGMMRLGILLLVQKQDSRLTEVIATEMLDVYVTDQVNLTVVTGHNAAHIKLDGTSIAVDSSGSTTVNTTVGTHSLQVSETLVLAPDVIEVFHSWSDGITTPRRAVVITDNTQLQVFYRRLYLVRAVSRFGATNGTGWYENNSTIALSTFPTILEIADSEGPAWLVLSGWNEGRLHGSRVVISARGAEDHTAQWDLYRKDSPPGLPSILALTGSICLFFSSTVVKMKRRADDCHVTTQSLNTC